MYTGDYEDCPLAPLNVKIKTKLSMKIKFIMIAFGVLAIIAGLVGLFLFQCEDDWCFVFEWQKIQAADSFSRCANLGFPVMESYPRQCRAGTKLFLENIEP